MVKINPTNIVLLYLLAQNIIIIILVYAHKIIDNNKATHTHTPTYARTQAHATHTHSCIYLQINNDILKVERSEHKLI